MPETLTPHTWVAEGNDGISWQPTKEMAERDLVGNPAGLGFATEVYPLYRLRWIPVGERLPVDGQEVLAMTADDRRLVLQYHNRMGGGRWGHDSLDADAYPLRVTHWMPLPGLPATVAEQT